MGKYLGPKLKLSRSIGIDLFLKSSLRDIESKCKINHLPGVHSYRKRRISEYGIQLREKQKIRRMYMITDRQLYNYYKKSLKLHSNTGEILLQFLERRLDNIVYRMGFATTRLDARQLVNHKLIVVNNHIINIPSYLVCINDCIEVRDKAKKYQRIIYAKDLFTSKAIPVLWLDIDISKLVGRVKLLPLRDMLPPDIKEKLIIEYYSR